MYFNDALKSSLQTIINHKFRSFLTLLGIMIGVTSVVAMFSSVNGIKMIIDENMSKMGWENKLVIQPGSNSSQRMGGRGMYFSFRTSSAGKKTKPISYEDFEAIKRDVEAKYLYGFIENWFRRTTQGSKGKSGSETIVFTSGTLGAWNRLRAVTEDYFHLNNYELKEGHFFNAFEMSRAEKVCIVGPGFSKDELDGEEPLGKYYTADGHRFRIVGVLDNDPMEKTQGIFNFNSWQRRSDLQAIYIPLKTGATYLRRGMALDNITMQSNDSESFNDMQNRASQVLLSRHNMQKDFTANDVGAEILEITKELEDMMKKWSITLFVIAAVSLVVGGIGLFSTLLISINERMMEIGVRKSLGAKDSDIFFYFITEAITLSVISAIFGILLGILITFGLGAAIKTHVPLAMISVYIGLGFAFVIGFLSGLYPALRAANINPIQAIYYFE